MKTTIASPSKPIASSFSSHWRFHFSSDCRPNYRRKWHRVGSQVPPAKISSCSIRSLPHLFCPTGIPTPHPETPMRAAESVSDSISNLPSAPPTNRSPVPSMSQAVGSFLWSHSHQNVKCSASGQTQTVLKQTPTITKAPVKDKMFKSSDIQCRNCQKQQMGLCNGYHAAQVSYQGLKDTFSDHNHDPGSSAGLHCMVPPAKISSCSIRSLPHLFCPTGIPTPHPETPMRAAESVSDSISNLPSAPPTNRSPVPSMCEFLCSSLKFDQSNNKIPVFDNNPP
ncbi:hypothetical protein LINPERHAP1_LOCUS43285 [Linum perenne]